MNDFFRGFGTPLEDEALTPQSQTSSEPDLLREEPEEEEATRQSPSDFFRGFGTPIEQPTAATPEEEEEAPEGFTGQFMTGRSYQTVRDYMEVNFGMTEDRYSREDIVRSYITNMRRFNAGQSVVTVSELAKLYQAGDDITKYTDAYRLWDEANGVFSDEADATVGEQIRGLYDYARAAIVDPVNLFSFGFGKLAGMGASRVAAEGGRRLAAREVAQIGLREAMSEAAEQAASRASGTALERRLAVAEARRQARNDFVAELAEGTTRQASQYQQALRRGAQAEIVAGGAFEAVASGTLDLAYQNAMIEANIQEDINPLQLGISTFAPAAFASAFLARSTGSMDIDRLVRQDSVQTAIENSTLVRVNAAIKAGRDAATRSTPEQAVRRVRENIQEASAGFRTWTQKVEAGQIQVEGKTINRVTETDAFGYFLRGEPAFGVNGLSQALTDIFDDETLLAISRGSERGMDALANTIEFLPVYAQRDVIDFFNNTVGRANPSLKTDNTRTIANYISETASDWGRKGGDMSQATGIFRNATPNASLKLNESNGTKTVGQSIIEEMMNGGTEVATKEVVEETKNGLIKTFQNNYIRMLVTHPGTTMLNLVGYASVSGINAAATTLRGTLYGSAGLIHGLVTGKGTASEYVQKAAFEFGTLKRQLSNLVNPYATYDDAMSYLLARPAARKELFKYIAGGVESKVDENAILRSAGLENASPTDANYFERYMQAFQVAYGVRAVDFFSKTQDFMLNLDRQVRRKYGQSYHEFLQRDDFAEIMTSKNSQTFKDFLEIESAAVQETLRTTFNKSYARDEVLGAFAKPIEEIRNIPIIGALAPFGQFFNNTVALTSDLVGLTPIYHLFLKANAKLGGKKITPDRNMMEMLSKMAIGWGIMGYYVNEEMQLLEEGIPLFAERQSNGAVVNRAYDFPLSAFKGYARIAAHYLRDGAVPADVLTQVGDMVGPASFSRQLSDTYGSVIDGFMEVMNDPESELKDMVLHTTSVAAAQYASGFSRNLDPLNQIVALSRGEEYEAIDRSVGNKAFNNAIRYVDQFAEPFLDPERRAPVSPLTGREPTAQTNRIFGYRELPAPSSIERMFAEIGRANWKTELRVPDGNAGRILDQHIYPILESEAARLLESTVWQGLSLDRKEAAVRSVLTSTRGRMLESLRRSYLSDDRKAEMIYSIFNSSLPAASRDRLIAAYDVEPETLWTLTEDQLENLMYLMEREGGVERRFREDIREGEYRAR